MSLFITSCTENVDSEDYSKNTPLKKYIKTSIVPADNVLPPEKYKMGNATVTRLNKPVSIPKKEVEKIKLEKTDFSFTFLNSTILDKSHPAYPQDILVAALPVTAQLPKNIKANVVLSKTKKELFSLDENDGLPFSFFAGLFEDKDGAIWSCSRSGTAWKYEGSQFLHYTELTGLPDYSVVNMLFDSDGDIWFGASTALVKYDGESFVNYSEKNQVSNLKPTKIVEDHFGNIWVGSHGGLYRIDKKTNTVAHFDEGSGLQKDEVNGLFCDRKGRIWVMYNNLGLSLIDLDQSDSGYTYTVSNYKSDNSSLFNYVQCVIQDEAGQLYIGNSHELVVIPDQELKKGKSIDAQCCRLANSGRFFVYCLAEDKNSNILFGKDEGVFQLHLDDSRNVEYATQKFKDDLGGIIPAIHVDDENYLWVATLYWHITRISLNTSIRKVTDEYGINERVYSIVEDQLGHIWFLTSKGELFCLQNPNKINQERLLDYSAAVGSGINALAGLQFDSQGDIWAIQNDKLLKLEVDNNGEVAAKVITEFPSEVKITNFFDLLVDKQGAIWLADNSLSTSDKNLLSSAGGLYRVSDGQMEVYLKQQGLISDDIRCLDQDLDGNLWISCIFQGLVKYEQDYNNGKGRWIHYKDDLIKKREFFMSPDYNEGVFVSGIQGVIHITGQVDTPFQEVFHYTMNNNRLTSDDFHSLIFDEYKNIWVAHEGGLDKIIRDDPSSANSSIVVDSYTEPLYFQKDFTVYSKMLQDDKIILGCNSDMLLMDIDHTSEKYMTNDIFLQKVNLFGDDIDWQNFGESENEAMYDSLSPFQRIPVNLSLSYESNYLNLHYTVTEIHRPHKLEYKYILDGYEDAWNKSTKETVANYPNLPHGKYVFKAQARVGLGEWGEMLTYPFSIRPPWWYSWWAYIAYFILFMLSIITLFKYFQDQKFEKMETLRLKELDLLKTRLYTNITHEFRTPLTVITGMSSQMKEDPEQWFDTGLSMIQRNANRLLGLVNQMLDLSKLESGKIKIQNEQNDIIVYLKYLVESVQSFAESKELQVHFHSDENELIMDYDPEKIQQIITNLLSNAMKFTPSGGNIYVLVRKIDVNIKNLKARLQIIVKDTGRGIPEDQILYIFDRFYQIDDSNTRQGEGSGIGLALIKELVHIMGGEITVRSILGKETEFKIKLPINNKASLGLSGKMNSNIDDVSPKAMNKLSVIEKSDVEQKETDVPSFSKPQILIVEDNHDIVAYIASCLAENYDIKVGANGQEGIDIAIENIPDLIITDVMMPIKDGFEVVETLKTDTNTSHIPIIMLTAKSDMESKLEGLSKGADAYLAKPFHKDELLIRIQTLLESRKLLQNYYLSLADGTDKASSESITVDDSNTVESVFVLKIKEALENNYEKYDFTIDKLSIEMNMSQSQLLRKVNAVLGMTPSRYIRHFRMSKAKKMLKETDDTVASITLSVGFTDPGYFSRMFKKEFGETANKWRGGNSS